MEFSMRFICFRQPKFEMFGVLDAWVFKVCVTDFAIGELQLDIVHESGVFNGFADGVVNAVFDCGEQCFENGHSLPGAF